MALRYLPMISGQQHHHHGNEKQQPVHLPVAVYSGQEQPQGPECKQTVTTHRYPNRYFPRDDLGNKQLDSDHNRQSPQQPLGSEYPPGNRIASHDPTAVSQKTVSNSNLYFAYFTQISKVRAAPSMQLFKATVFPTRDTAAAGAALPPDKTEMAVTTAIVI